MVPMHGQVRLVCRQLDKKFGNPSPPPPIYKCLGCNPGTYTWVIDLFAGYGSLRAVAKAQGLNYLAVDMRDLVSAAKKPTATGKE